MLVRDDGSGADLISVLPEELLLQVLRRLGCTRAAARTSLLSRPWRRLWTGLPELTFRDASVRSITAALSYLQHDATLLSLLDVAFTAERRERLAADLPSLLAELSPEEFRLALPMLLDERAHADLPAGGFHHTTSIQLYALDLTLKLPPRSNNCAYFPKLQKLTLSGCIVDVAELVRRCPCLRVLRVNELASLDGGEINIRSDSLRKLSLRTRRYRRDMWTDSINVEAPMLKHLAVSLCTGTHITVSVVAPVLEKVYWECYDGADHEYDFLKEIFTCAPMLTTMVVTTWAKHRCTKIQDIFNAYPLVECKLFCVDSWFGR